MKNINILLKLLLAVICLFLFGCEKEETLQVSKPEVTVAKVRSQKISESTSIIGEVVSKDEVYLRARVTGFLEKRLFKEGAFIKKDDLLFQIEKTEYQANVESAQAQLETAKASLKRAMIDYDRQKYLLKKDVVAQKEYDLAECAKAKAEAEVLEAKAGVQEAELKLSYTDIPAPFSGKIGKSAYSVGNLVGIESDPLALLVKTDPINVEFNISESILVSVIQYAEKKGKLITKKQKEESGTEFISVKLILANATEYPLEGKIDFIDNVINPMTGTILVRAEFENPNFLLIPGAYVNVVVGPKYKTDCLLIPQAAIQEDQTGKFVMLIDDKNKVVKKTIKTGTTYGTDIVALEGLKLGDCVIQEGLQKVRAGMEVNPVEVKKTEDNVAQEQGKADVNNADVNKSSNLNSVEKTVSGKIDKKETNEK